MIKLNRHPRDLFTSALKVTCVRAVGIVLQTVVILYLARAFSLDDMGYLAIAFAILGLARMQGPLGLDQVAMRDISKALGENDVEKAQAISTTSLTFVLLANTGFSLIGFVTLVLARQQIHLGIVDCAIASLAILSFALNGLLAGQIRGFGKPLLAQAPDSIGLQTLFGLGLLGLHVFDQVHLSAVLIILTLASWSVTGIYLFCRRRTGIHASFYPTRNDLWDLAKEGSKISQALIFTHLSARAPLLLSTPLLGPAATAVLEIATRFGTLSTVVTTSVAATFSPRFAVLAEQSATDELRKTAYLAAALSFIPSILTLIGFTFIVPSLFGWLLPPAYAEAYVPLLIIAAASALNGALAPASNALIMAGRPDPVRLISFIRLFAIITFCVLLAAPYGIVGMAWAIFLATLLRDGGLAIIAHLKLGKKPDSTEASPGITNNRDGIPFERAPD